MNSKPFHSGLVVLHYVTLFHSEFVFFLYLSVRSVPLLFTVHSYWTGGGVSRRLLSDMSSCVYTTLKSAYVCAC